MVIYGLIVSWPYAIHVRGPGTEKANLLDLGTFHQKVKSHIRNIIANPDIVFGNDLSPSPEACTLDGRSWRYPEAFAAVQKLAPSLPQLRDVTIAYFEGTLPVWMRFTAEFDEGGIIDGLSEEERNAAHMATTNDANEGILGQMRQDKRTHVNSTTHAFNARAMFRRNNTQAYMDANFATLQHVLPAPRCKWSYKAKGRCDSNSQRENRHREEDKKESAQRQEG
jgi:hypothetical protein